MPVVSAMKDWVVTFDASGEALVARDVTDLVGNPPKPRILPVRAKTMAEALKTAKALYTFAH